MNLINSLLMCTMVLILATGCATTSDPRQRFETFVQALKDKNEQQIKDSLEKGSFKFLVEAGTSKNPSLDWLSNLSRDTLESNPSFSSLDWILRDQQAKINYTSQDGTKNFILLVLVNKEWKIRLNPMGSNDQNITEYQVTK